MQGSRIGKSSCLNVCECIEYFCAVPAPSTALVRSNILIITLFHISGCRTCLEEGLSWPTYHGKYRLISLGECRTCLLPTFAVPHGTSLLPLPPKLAGAATSYFLPVMRAHLEKLNTLWLIPKHRSPYVRRNGCHIACGLTVLRPQAILGRRKS